MCAQEKLEHGVGLEVEVWVIGVLVYSETWLTGTGCIGGLSGSDVILSGPTQRHDLQENKQKASKTHIIIQRKI